MTMEAARECVRQDGGRQRHPLLHILAGLVELVRDGIARRFGQVGLVDHVGDKIAVAFLGGNPPRGGMRLAQVTHLGQGRHLVADGGSAQIQLVMFHQAA